MPYQDLFTFGEDKAAMLTTRGMTAIINESPLYQTEGIRYSGSKRTLIPFIHAAIRDLPIRTVLDGFSGSTRVGQFLKKAGYLVTSNDLAIYSYVLGTAYLVNNTPASQCIKDKIAHLNNLRPVDGYFTEYYGGDDDGSKNVISADGKKKPFLRKNTRRLDAIRPEIDRIASNETERCILLTALINGLDKVENTLGHQVAYLAKWAGRSFENLSLEVPALIESNKAHKVMQRDAAEIGGNYDLAYFDPPYNTNNKVTITTRVRYASYYHLWTTIVKNDKPAVVGASNRREDMSSDRIPGVITPYESTREETVEAEFDKLFRRIDAPFILLSYSNKGKITPERCVDIMSQFGQVDVTRIDHKENVQRTLTINQQWLGDQSQNYEYLFLLRKR